MGKVKKKHLWRIGFESNEACQAAMVAMNHEAYQRRGRESKLQLLQDLLQRPEAYLEHEVLGTLAGILAPDPNAAETDVQRPLLRAEPLAYKIYGSEQIEAGAKHQMHVASKLPVARAAALMPDAHQGYGLPIGGVLATHQAVIPFAVGVDIGCRMCLSVYPLSGKHLERYRYQLTQSLKEHTTFGTGNGPKQPMEDPVLERQEFQDLPVVKSLKDKAWRQIGSSGSGNHFVEFGLVHLAETEPDWPLEPGTYLVLLSHSGSRGLGAGIAKHYTNLAMQQTRLPKEARHLAWLDLSHELGTAYWRAMNLAGDYASACHHHIHHRLSKAIGEAPVVRIENHHNFAWKERLSDGQEVIVHRKGATPAGKGVLGVIPGSMTAPGFIVRGRGVAASIQSASHGAGRAMSR
ncbi:MAG: RtcB family protein, partial [Bacteroidota bacterium]